MGFFDLIERTIEQLQKHKRVSLHALRLEFDIEEEQLQALVRELTEVRGLATCSEQNILILKEADASPEIQRGLGHAERRHVTVLFCDLAGSTELSQHVDPEDFRDIVRAYQDLTARVVEKYEGCVGQYIGDGIILYFGWPQAHEEDVSRAALTALELIQRVETDLNPKLRDSKDLEVSIRIGMHTGRVVVGGSFEESRWENLAMGDTVNIAARLEGIAQKGSIVLSHASAELLGGGFELEDLGEVSLKGVLQTVRAHRLVAASKDATKHRAGRQLTKLQIGRDAEMAALVSSWNEVLQGKKQVLAVKGEPGIGKSTLVEAFWSLLKQEGVRRLSFAMSPFFQNTQFHPVSQLLREQLGSRDTETLGKLQEFIQHLSIESEQALPALARLAGIDLPADLDSLRDLEPLRRRQHMEEAVLAWLRAEAEQGPLLVVWEDLHWIDPSTKRLLERILSSNDSPPCMYLVTFRPEFEATWPSNLELTLNRLRIDSIAPLVQATSSGKHVSETVLDYIAERTDGIPLFVEELTRALDEAGLLSGRENASLSESASLEGLRVPESLVDSLMSRLDRLGEARELAQVASVIGRHFDRKLLSALGAFDGTHLEEALQSLESADLIERQGGHSESTYSFRHALISRDGYRSLLKSRRQQLHSALAKVLDSEYPDIARLEPERLASHYSKAGEATESAKYWLKAAELAASTSSFQETVAHCERGIQQAELDPDSTRGLQRELQFRLLLGPSLVATRSLGSSEIRRNYGRAKDVSHQLNDSSKDFIITAGLWRYYNNVGRIDDARVQADALVRLAEERDDANFSSFAACAVGFSESFAGNFHKAETYFDQAIDLTGPETFHRSRTIVGFGPAAICRMYAGYTYTLIGHLDRARQVADEAKDIALSSGNLLTQANLYWWRARALAFQGYLDEAESDLGTLLVMAADFNWPMYVGLAKALLGEIAMRRGDSNARTLITEGLEINLNAGHEIVRTFTSDMQAASYLHDGELDAGAEYCVEVLNEIERRNLYSRGAATLRVYGEIEEARSGSGEAHILKAIEMAQKQGAHSLELLACMSLARIWQVQGKREEAYKLVYNCYSWFSEGLDGPFLKEAQTLLTELKS